MNHVYRIVWNHVACTWQAVAESAKGFGKGRQGKSRARLSLQPSPRFSIKPLLAALSLISSSAWAGPLGGQVVAGSATIQQAGNTTTINQSTNRAAIDWTSFSVGKAESVRFNQPSTSAITLNRVTGTESSQILGSMSANGQVFILNPNGVLFGKGAQVNVGGLVASTHGMSNADFMDGNYQLSGNGTGAVINQGKITVIEGGTIALIAPIVKNTGTLTANRGSVLLAAADAVSLKLQDGSLIGYTLDKGSLQALVDNGGLIHADGGHVVLTAKALDALSKATINHSGIIEAQTVANKNGVVELLGDMQVGEIKLSGKIDASAPNGGDGGFVETSAAKVRILDGHRVSTLAAKGKTGTWLIDPNDYTIAASGGDITGSQLSSVLVDTSVTLRSSNGATAGNGDINVNDAVSWSANTLTLTAARDININAVLTASGSSALVMNTGTANGSDSAVPGGTVRVGFAPGEANGFAGRVDFPGRSGTGFLTINGQGYTVINSLGAEGSTTGMDLQGMQGNLSGYYALGSNIDASATSSWNSGAGFAPIGDYYDRFSGVLDGLGHRVSNLTINRAGNDYIGLMGYNDSTLRNIGVVGGSISGRFYVGGLVGYNNLGTISNAYATGSVSGSSWVSGLVGFNYLGTINKAYATGGVSGSSGVGGLLGWNNGTITNAYATGSVSGGSGVGGLVGQEDYGGGTISNAYATGSVSGTDVVGGLVGKSLSTISNAYATGIVTGSEGVGGLVGISWSTISNAYATGSVSGSRFVGGLAGYNNTGTISGAYATGGVSGSQFVGGLVGVNYFNSTISYAYATGSVSGSSYVGGLLGYNSGTINNSFWDTQTSGQATSAGGTGKTTAEMQQQATFSNWDFANTWRIYEGQSTPVLRTLQRQVVVTANNDSKTYDATAYSGGNGVSYSDVSAPLVGTVAYGGDSQGAINAGQYTISASGLSLNRTTQQDYQNWSGIVFKDGKLLINRASLNLIAVQGERTYDGTPYAYAKDVTALTGVFAGDRVQVVSGAGELDGKNAGERNLVSVGTLTLGGASASNYQLTTTGSKWTILKRPLTIVANDSTKIYGEVDPALTYFIASGSLVGGEALSGGLTRVVGENVIDGGYAIQLGTLSAGNNYAITFNNNLSHLAINPRPVSLIGKREYYNNDTRAFWTDIVDMIGILESDKSNVFVPVYSAGVLDSALPGDRHLQSIGFLRLEGTGAGNYVLTTTGSRWTIKPPPPVDCAVANACLGSVSSIASGAIVTIYRSNGIVSVATEGDAIVVGDIIQVEGGSNGTVLSFSDGSTLPLDGGSTVSIEPGSQGGSIAEGILSDGGLWGRVITETDGYYIGNNDHVAGVRG